MMRRGSVKHWNVNRGFGFIVPDDDQDGDVFVHVSNLPEGVLQLAIGDTVTFEVAAGQDGRLKAVNVTPA